MDRYHKCGKLFTSKARMKEHVLGHLEVDPPVQIRQCAIMRELPTGGWVVVRDLGLPEDDGQGAEGGSGGEVSQIGSSGDVDKFRITGESSFFFDILFRGRTLD